MIDNEILDLEFTHQDFDEPTTLRKYFKAILKTMFEDGESFSGKRPLGNSGWECDIWKFFIENKLINGVLDEDGYVKSMDDEKFYEIMNRLIASL